MFISAGYLCSTSWLLVATFVQYQLITSGYLCSTGSKVQLKWQYQLSNSVPVILGCSSTGCAIRAAIPTDPTSAPTLPLATGLPPVEIRFFSTSARSQRASLRKFFLNFGRRDFCHKIVSTNAFMFPATKKTIFYGFLCHYHEILKNRFLISSSAGQLSHIR